MKVFFLLLIACVFCSNVPACNYEGAFMTDCRKTCVTSGSAYTDIDTLACAIAYGELKKCDVVLPGKLNGTVPESIRKMCSGHFLNEAAQKYNSFVIVDVSDPRYFPKFVNEDEIEIVFDHHFGFEQHWKDRGNIEFLGACATLIFEEFEAAQEKPSELSANLLYTAIFANTLNFNASITNDRDIKAFKALEKYVDLPKDWIKEYYVEVERVMLSNLEYALTNDIKVLSDNGWAIAQIELYDASSMIKNSEFIEALEKCTSKYSDWILTMPSISEGKNYLISHSDEIKHIFANPHLGVTWDGNVGSTGKLFLRKEILKILGVK